MKQFNSLTIYPVILAGGKGTRMNEGRPSPIPKVLIPLGGKPMISYILETLKNLETEKLKNINSSKNLHLKTYDLQLEKPILVVGYKGDLIKKEFGNKCEYVEQKRRLGTGHAAKLAMEYIAKNFKKQATRNKQIPNFKCSNSKQFDNCDLNIENCLSLVSCNLVLILQGDDSAFYKAETLKKFIENHIKNKTVLSFLTTKIPSCKDLGRVIRDQKGNVTGIVEKENLTPEQEKIDEINCGGYLANYDWLVENIKKIKKHLKKGKEYPLPDIIKLAISYLPLAISKKPIANSKEPKAKSQSPVIAYQIPASQWIGINSPEQLEYAEKQKNSQNNYYCI